MVWPKLLQTGQVIAKALPNCSLSTASQIAPPRPVKDHLIGPTHSHLRRKRGDSGAHGEAVGQEVVSHRRVGRIGCSSMASREVVLQWWRLNLFVLCTS